MHDVCVMCVYVCVCVRVREKYEHVIVLTITLCSVNRLSTKLYKLIICSQLFTPTKKSQNKRAANTV